MTKFLFKVFSIYFFTYSVLYADSLKNINISGNDRISSQTIEMFTNVSVGDELDQNDVNRILKNLYKTNFFNNVKVEFSNQILKIFVEENPIIEKIVFKGVKAKKIKKLLSKSISLKSRSSFNTILLQKDKQNMINALKELGYYFSTVSIYIEEIEDNKINLTYDINIGDKAKIKKISFIGNKFFKDSKLRNIIITEEYKFWKFISGRKFLNEYTIETDKRLIKNFYLSKGFYNVTVNSSFAKLVDENKFELIFNIDAKEKIFFGDIKLNLPVDFNSSNFNELNELFSKLQGKPYSINSVNKILKKIDQITLSEEFHSIKATVDEELFENKINLEFKIIETEKLYVEKINILGNNITREEVIRNQLLMDEGDPYNEILQARSINNIKSTNFFKKVDSQVYQGKKPDSKIIDILVEEKATGEISAGAGAGTDGGTLAFAVKENNYLGKGIALEANATLTDESIKGLFSVTNPNFNNSDKSLNFTIEATELDRSEDFGYKNNKVGFLIGSTFEYLDDLYFGVSTSSYYEKIETNSSASARQQAQEGNYWDTFGILNFDYDKRNQKFQTSEGIRSRYSVNLPIISKTNTFSNSFDYKIFSELFDQNVSTASFFFKASNSLTNDDIKLSERLFVPTSKLRGFEKGKIGPKDGEDFIGGNYVASINFTSTIPQVFENVQNVDFAVFFDAANVWGVDYDSSLDSSDTIKSSIGVGLDWFTVIGPMNFSLALPLTKDTTDKTESFRFNLGTTF